METRLGEPHADELWSRQHGDPPPVSLTLAICHPSIKSPTRENQVRAASVAFSWPFHDPSGMTGGENEARVVTEGLTHPDPRLCRLLRIPPQFHVLTTGPFEWWVERDTPSHQLNGSLIFPVLLCPLCHASPSSKPKKHPHAVISPKPESTKEDVVNDTHTLKCSGDCPAPGPLLHSPHPWHYRPTGRQPDLCILMPRTQRAGDSAPSRARAAGGHSLCSRGRDGHGKAQWRGSPGCQAKYLECRKQD